MLPDRFHCALFPVYLANLQTLAYCHEQLLPPANEVWGKVIFSEACVKNSVHRGGEGGVPHQVPPPGRGRYTPPGTRQVHPPGPGRYPPGPGRYTPPGPGRYTPPGPGRYPPGPGRYPPGPGRYPPSPPEIRSTRGRYASYWNAILLHVLLSQVNNLTTKKKVIHIMCSAFGTMCMAILLR